MRSVTGSEGATPAYKFLAPGAIGPFTGFPWSPGNWVEAAGQLELCGNGIHACRAEQLPTWIDEELWAVELGDEVVDAGSVLVARSARLTARVEAWNRGCGLEFARACAERAQEYGGMYAEDAVLFADSAESAKDVAVVSYVAARAAEDANAGGFAEERRRQAAWLRGRLGLEP